MGIHTHPRYTDAEARAAAVSDAAYAAGWDGVTTIAPSKNAVYDKIESLPTGGYTEGARVYHSANQGTTSGGWTILAFNSERYDTDVIHDNSTNNSRLTCRTAGKYMISATLVWAASSTGKRLMYIRLGGTTNIAVASELDGGSVNQWQGLTTIYDLGVGDFVEVRVLQVSTGDLDVLTSSDSSPEFMMQRIG